MTREEIYARLKGIFADVFGRDVPIEDETAATTVEGWDSFQNITLMGAIEDEFGVKFSIQDVIAFKNVGDIVRFLQAI